MLVCASLQCKFNTGYPHGLQIPFAICSSNTMWPKTHLKKQAITNIWGTVDLNSHFEWQCNLTVTRPHYSPYFFFVIQIY